MLSQEVGDKVGIAYGLEGLAGVAAGQGEVARAARLWGAAEALRRVLGAPLPPTEGAKFAPMVVAAQAQVDPVTWAAAWAEGRAMPLEQAVAYALEDEGTQGVGT